MLKVLDKIQPATAEEWEAACWEDLRKRSAACLSRGMNDGLWLCKEDKYAIADANEHFRLAEPLKATLTRLEVAIRHGEEEEARENAKHDAALIANIQKIPGNTIRSALVALVKETEVGDILRRSVHEVLSRQA